ncbi:phosphatase PAP2 family protein [Candidatus Saccharibacteria bacterium]|nr:phosphatase PAP2 family protein [Candidatus Saccharibacteria bacterium]
MKKRWIVAAVLGLLAIAFTVALKFVDVRPVGPAMTEVGFGTTNSTIFTSITPEKNWLTVSNIMIGAIIVAGVLFVLLGFWQLIKRKSFKEVDWSIKMLAVTYVLMLGVYIFFEKICVFNYRPVLIDGNLEPSFPSSHTLFATTIALTVMMILPNYVKSKAICLILDVILAAMVFITANGRIAGGVHWTSDVIGALLYGAFLASLYYCLMKIKSKKEIED